MSLGCSAPDLRPTHRELSACEARDADRRCRSEMQSGRETAHAHAERGRTPAHRELSACAVRDEPRAEPSRAEPRSTKECSRRAERSRRRAASKPLSSLSPSVSSLLPPGGDHLLLEPVHEHDRGPRRLVRRLRRDLRRAGQAAPVHRRAGPHLQLELRPPRRPEGPSRPLPLPLSPTPPGCRRLQPELRRARRAARQLGLPDASRLPNRPGGVRPGGVGRLLGDGRLRVLDGARPAGQAHVERGRGRGRPRDRVQDGVQRPLRLHLVGPAQQRPRRRQERHARRVGGDGAAGRRLHADRRHSARASSSVEL